MSKRHECSVWGALALTLRVSRVAGVAPLRMVRERDGWRASVSRPVALYGYTLLFALHTGILTGIALDLNLDKKRSVITRTPTATTMWLIESFVVTTIVTIQAQTINKTLKSGADTKTLTGALAIVGANWYFAEYLSTFLFEAFTHNKDWRVVIIYSCFFFEFLMMTLLLLQFIFIALVVKSLLKSINDTLSDLIYTVDLQRMSYMPCYLASTGNIKNIAIPIHSINIAVDKMHVKEKMKKFDSTTEANLEEHIRSLILYFGTACDVVRRVDRSYGHIMLLIVGSYMLYLVVPAYYFVSFLLSTKMRRLDVMLQVINYLFHFTYTVIGVEPGHRTSLEMDRTQQLVTELVQRVSTAQDSVTLGSRNPALGSGSGKVTYSPMGVCTNKPANTLLGTSNKSECVVWGALATSLRLSRLFGGAPLRLVRERNGWRAKAYRVYRLAGGRGEGDIAQCTPLTSLVSTVRRSLTAHISASIAPYRMKRSGKMCQ
ncbi:uncharacterized protein LOC126376384 [Pectinophora gossypiella]|uniref:uncharacterized protein LOC126376384 n=1 Tax=Pectinophora gossypiella TaxID=13191 RepID=UPI00214EBF5F|nr:uncharacterized protein LOC126376384 [Pectinophora gossypiella]